MKNIIINKENQNNTINFSLSDKVINRIKKYNNLYSIIINSELSKINLYDYVIDKKILLYEPTEYAGWLLFLDYVNNEIITDKNGRNILLDSGFIGFIELLKNVHELDDNFFVENLNFNSLSTKKNDYLITMFNIKEPKKTTINYDLIISSNIDNVISYIDILKTGGKILLILSIKDITISLIDRLNQNLKLFDQIEFIEPSITKLTGEFIICFHKKSEVVHHIKNSYGTIMLKANNFFDYHLYRINKILNSLKYIIDITNTVLQKKLILTYENKMKSIITNLLNSYNIPINTTIKIFYTNKLLSITNKLFSSLNIMSYAFINYEQLQPKINILNKNGSYDNLYNISLNLSAIKRAIDTKYIKKWNYVTYQLDNYKSLGVYASKKYNLLLDREQKVTNAFFKIYEMLITYDIIPKDILTLKSFHFCEAPGMFIIGVNHFLRTKTNVKDWVWYGNSLNKDIDATALDDNYGLIKKNKDNWINGPESDGDIRLLTNIEYFKEKLDKVDFITSDCGICVDKCMLNKYEELIAETDYAQFINTLNLLKVGGSAIIKTFIPLKIASNVCIIYMLTTVFEEVYLSKPITSRPQNSEVYLVCKKFLGIENAQLNELKKILDKSINKKFNANLNWIENIPQSFINQLEDYVLDITRQQISYLLNIFHFVDNTHEIDKITILSNGKLKEKNNEYWCKKFNLESNNKTKLI